MNFGVHSCTQRAKEEVSTGIVGKKSCSSALHVLAYHLAYFDLNQ
jgi:hypothetical protein